MEKPDNIALSFNAQKVLQSRYLLRGEKSRESADDMFRRVARAVAAAELQWGNEAERCQWEDMFYRTMEALLFLPNSPTLMNAGTPLNQLSACFVLPVEDNLDGIFTSLKHAALIQQSGGGTGFNFSRLRPKNDPITVTEGTASGPVSFMKIFNEATEHIKYGGKRRGANMGILNIDHPDIEEFIVVKREEGVLNNFNLSVGISDAFMYAVMRNSKWTLIHPNKLSVVKTVDARALWDMMADAAWNTGDPGLIFLNTINESNPLPLLGRIECTNPCGEVPLLPYESCNLGSIDLAKFLNAANDIDWEKLERVVKTAVRFLDDVIEITQYPVPEVKARVHGNRKIGLGVMGWADLLVQLNIPYDSDDAVGLAGTVMKFIRQTAVTASAQLARKRGVFPNWNNSRLYPKTPLRNATLLSIAPTGTISIIASTSSSIEPLFALAYDRKNVLEGETLHETNRHFIRYLCKTGLYSNELADVVKCTGTVSPVKTLPDHVKRLFKTALEITPEWHLKHQVAFQRHVDNAVSKTINLPEDATRTQIADIYMEAWKQKAKGITIFRYNSKSRQVLQKGVRADVKACGMCIS